MTKRAKKNLETKFGKVLSSLTELIMLEEIENDSFECEYLLRTYHIVNSLQTKLIKKGGDNQ